MTCTERFCNALRRWGARGGSPTTSASTTTTVELPGFDDEGESDVGSFYSFTDDELDTGVASFAPWRTSIRKSLLEPVGEEAPSRAVAVNKNPVSAYAWTSEVLELIVGGRARGATSDADSGKVGSPLLVVAGACPNKLCGMQVVMLCCMDGGIAWNPGGMPAVDFWWLKPRNGDPRALEPETLRRHASGPHKNDPGRSAAVYQPLANKFNVGGRDGDFVFGVDAASGRAYVEDERGRMLVYFVWQEEWSPPMAFKKFLRGKMCYERQTAEGDTKGLWERLYEIRDGQIAISTDGERRVASVLPPDSFQLTGW